MRRVVRFTVICFAVVTVLRLIHTVTGQGDVDLSSWLVGYAAACLLELFDA